MMITPTLRTLRERARMTQEGLAHRAGVSHATISRLERGNTVPNTLTRKALARVLKVPVEAISFPVRVSR